MLGSFCLCAAPVASLIVGDPRIATDPESNPPVLPTVWAPLAAPSTGWRVVNTLKV